MARMASSLRTGDWVWMVGTVRAGIICLRAVSPHDWLGLSHSTLVMIRMDCAITGLPHSSWKLQSFL